MNSKDLHRAHDVFIAVALLASWLTLAVCSGCGFVTEGVPCNEDSSSSGETDAVTGTSTLGTSASSTTAASATSSPTSSVAESGASGESSGDGPVTDTSTGTGETDGESSAGSSSESTDGGPVSCETNDDCGAGEWCDWYVDFVCEPEYTDAHCDESCPLADRVHYEHAAGWTACVCAPTCQDDGDCDAPATCGSLGAIDRCFMACDLVPCPDNTGAITCPPVPVSGYPDVYVCVWFGEG